MTSEMLNSEGGALTCPRLRIRRRALEMWHLNSKDTKLKFLRRDFYSYYAFPADDFCTKCKRLFPKEQQPPPATLSDFFKDNTNSPSSNYVLCKECTQEIFSSNEIPMEIEDSLTSDMDEDELLSDDPRNDPKDVNQIEEEIPKASPFTVNLPNSEGTTISTMSSPSDLPHPLHFSPKKLLEEIPRDFDLADPQETHMELSPHKIQPTVQIQISPIDMPPPKSVKRDEMSVDLYDLEMKISAPDQEMPLPSKCKVICSKESALYFSPTSSEEFPLPVLASKTTSKSSNVKCPKPPLRSPTLSDEEFPLPAPRTISKTQSLAGQSKTLEVPTTKGSAFAEDVAFNVFASNSPQVSPFTTLRSRSRSRSGSSVSSGDSTRRIRSFRKPQRKHIESEEEIYLCASNSPTLLQPFQTNSSQTPRNINNINQRCGARIRSDEEASRKADRILRIREKYNNPEYIQKLKEQEEIYTKVFASVGWKQAHFANYKIPKRRGPINSPPARYKSPLEYLSGKQTPPHDYNARPVRRERPPPQEFWKPDFKLSDMSVVSAFKVPRLPPRPGGGGPYYWPNRGAFANSTTVPSSSSSNSSDHKSIYWSSSSSGSNISPVAGRPQNSPNPSMGSNLILNAAMSSESRQSILSQYSDFRTPSDLDILVLNVDPRDKLHLPSPSH